MTGKNIFIKNIFFYAFFASDDNYWFLKLFSEDVRRCEDRSDGEKSSRRGDNDKEWVFI